MAHVDTWFLSDPLHLPAPVHHNGGLSGHALPDGKVRVVDMKVFQSLHLGGVLKFSWVKTKQRSLLKDSKGITGAPKTAETSGSNDLRDNGHSRNVVCASLLFMWSFRASPNSRLVLSLGIPSPP